MVVWSVPHTPYALRGAMLARAAGAWERGHSVITIGDIGPWSAGIAEAERIARCRELRALALVYLGHSHPLTVALAAAIANAAALEDARSELGRIPALRRRRLLASYGALL